MSTLTISPRLQARLSVFPQGLRKHVQRVQTFASELAVAHGVDPVQAELTAAAHDVDYHLLPRRRLEEAQRLGLPVNAVESFKPILLHGPVGAAWLRQEGTITDPEVLEGVRWHTTAHPGLTPVGRVVFLADKLDPAKAQAYPFQEAVREAAFRDLADGMLAFLDGALRLRLDRHDTVHPMSNETRNALLLAQAR